MKFFVILLLLTGLLYAQAHAQEGVDTMEFGAQFDNGGRADARRVRECYLSLVGKSDYEHSHQPIAEKPGAVALIGTDGGIFLLGLAGSRGASLFAPLPERTGKILLEFSAPGIRMKAPFTFMEPGKFSPFMDRLAVLKAGGNPLKSIRVKTLPVENESSLAHQLIALAAVMVPKTFSSFSKASQKNSEPYMQALRRCHEISDLQLRQLVDDEIAKFARARDSSARSN